MSLETPEERIIRERAANKVKEELRSFARNINGSLRESRPLNPKRHEELLRTYQQLQAPPARVVPQTQIQTTGSDDPMVVLGAGAFNRLIVVAGGDTYLQGGTVSGGNGGTHTFANRKVIDGTSGPAEPDDSILYIKVECEATVANGQMLPGCKVTAEGAHVWGTDASEVPDNHSFTTTAATGFLYYEVGRWLDDEFHPAAAGSNLRASGCIGNFVIRPLYVP